MLDAGSYKPTGLKGLGRAASAHPRWSSNFLLVGSSRSATGNPLFVAGPQIGYLYPGLTLEADIAYPGVQARGATSPGFAGNILIGRGPDYAWSLTSAGSDLIDTYVERLCGGSRTKYRYNGRCRTMGSVDAGTIEGSGRVRFRTTVHGPVVGLREGRRPDGRGLAASAPATARTSCGSSASATSRPARSTPRRRCARRCRARRSRSTSATPTTATSRCSPPASCPSAIAGWTRGCPRGARASTSGRASCPPRKHPYEVNPPSGLLVNWNNRPAPRWGAADDNWAYGSAQRVQMLDNGLATRDKHDLASVTSAMNAAATQDLRSVALTPALTELLKAAPAPSPRAARMLAILQEWRAGGSSRLDRDLDGVMDAGPGPAIWDAFYPRLFSAAMPVKGLGPLIGTNAGPSSRLHRRRLLVPREGPAAPQRRRSAQRVQGALLRQR